MQRFCIGTPSARYVAKMEDVLSVYERPYDPARPVVCVDECSKELRTTPRGTWPPVPKTDTTPAKLRREDYEYARQGTANLFLAVEPLAGRRKVSVTARRTARDFARFLQTVSDEMYPHADKIVLVTDNLNTHRPWCLYETFPAEDAHRLMERFEWHYTPEHGSWLNIAEIELSIMQRQCLARRLDNTLLTEEVAAWEVARNTLTGTIRWQFTAADARVKLRHLYPLMQTDKDQTK